MIPLSLYIHIPWCIRKCPYCDFNSYQQQGELAETKYIDCLIRDLDQHTALFETRNIHSIFIGGGTPSLFSAQAFDRLLSHIEKHAGFEQESIEITLEANPGTFEQKKFKDFKQAGINRLSLGIQSFNDAHLKQLGRVHSSLEAQRAIEGAMTADFNRINIDIMHGLPQQSEEDAVNDLETGLSFGTTHLSWYQLTLEPNTLFAKFPPTLPKDETLWDIQARGHELLTRRGFHRYEISAYCRKDAMSQHNLNYWQFGDYLGIGAGAHSKISDDTAITRFQKQRSPKDYMANTAPVKKRALKHDELPLEFMMNALRLCDGFDLSLLQRANLTADSIKTSLSNAVSKGLLQVENHHLKPTEQGLLYLNDTLMCFMA